MKFRYFTRTSSLSTTEWERAVIPNGELSNNKVINYSSEDRRKDAITVGISYDSNIKTARNVLMDIMEKDERIDKDPAPQVFCRRISR